MANTISTEALEPALRYFRPLASTQPVFLFFKFINLDNDDARIIIIDKSAQLQFQLNFKNVVNACVRAFSFYKFTPFAAPYFLWYNVALAVAKLVTSGVFLFHNRKEKSAEWCAETVEHGAFALYNFALSFFISATILNIPVFPFIYGVAPDQLPRFQAFLIDEKTGWLTEKVRALVYQVLQQPRPTPPPPPSEPPPSTAAAEPPRTPPRTHHRDASLVQRIIESSPATLRRFAERLGPYLPGASNTQQTDD
jgi:hypothetical protein